MRDDECLTLNDIGLTIYEFISGAPAARWYWDPRFRPPLKEEDTPLDENMLRDIEHALDTRIYHRKKQYPQRWRSMNHN